VLVAAFGYELDVTDPRVCLRDFGETTRTPAPWWPGM
jgi:hypothetical protein